MEMSVVITTYNRAAGLAQLLAGLEAQEDRAFEVVVAIDGGTDETETMLAGLRPSYPLRWLNTHCPGYGLAVARNRGILAAQGRAVVILDDDSRPVPGFIAAHRAGVRAGTITGGPRNPSDPDATRMAWKMAELGRLPPLTPLTIPDLRRDWPNAYLIENNICLLRDDWIAMGLFSERLKLYGFIGQEFFARAAHLGLRYQFNPAAAVWHHGEHEGDNGLNRARKLRQTRFAGLIRPSLETPTQFRAQIAWAAAQAAGHPAPPMPGFALHAGLALPGRVARMAARRLLRPLKRALRR
jgi:glycosyltransferase involved in cell wall biosynthesis